MNDTNTAQILDAIQNLHGAPTSCSGKIDIRIDGLVHRIGGLRSNVDGLNRRMGRVELRLDGIDHRLGGLARVDGRLEKLETRRRRPR